MPAQADKTGDESLLQWAETHCLQSLHPVHRLDRPAGGVLLLAKTPAAMTELQRQFQHHLVEKEYLAVVSALPPEPEGTLVHFLQKKAGQNRAIASPEELPDTERADLHYRLLGSSQRYHLLLIRLITGRHHQIRTQLAAIGCPIKRRREIRRPPRQPRSIHSPARLATGFRTPGLGRVDANEAPVGGDPVLADYLQSENFSRLTGAPGSEYM
jgi:23S rRNA pseudouridine1911/1915/1917 synthase